MAKQIFTCIINELKRPKNNPKTMVFFVVKNSSRKFLIALKLGRGTGIRMMHVPYKYILYPWPKRGLNCVDLKSTVPILPTFRQLRRQFAI